MKVHSIPQRTEILVRWCQGCEGEVAAMEMGEQLESDAQGTAGQRNTSAGMKTAIGLLLLVFSSALLVVIVRMTASVGPSGDSGPSPVLDSRDCGVAGAVSTRPCSTCNRPTTAFFRGSHVF
jgi:hypothetical protein